MRELLSRIDSAEITEWMELWRQEGWGEQRADLRNGIVASTIANYAGKTRGDGDPASPWDFMPYIERKAQNEPVYVDDPAEMSKLLKAAVFGKTPDKDKT